MSRNENIKVAVRVRPLIPKEINEGCSTCINIVGDTQALIGTSSFSFSHAFDIHADQTYVYDATVGGIIDRIFMGHNVTVFAYGQTGSGKTFTMGTNDTRASFDTPNCGIIPRALKDVFSWIGEKSDRIDFAVKVAFVELYREEFRDLLGKHDEHTAPNTIVLRESGIPNCGPVLVGAVEVPVFSFEEVMEHLASGNERRAVGATAMNAHSSRSHAILILTVCQNPKSNPSDVTMAKFRLVDLAGSESAKKTKATGDRLQEGIKINKGLLALGNVIEQAVKGQTMSVRDSKLTRLLQDSFGGNAHTLMLACVSPADSNMSETLNTLRYADRAQLIKNKPIVNRDPTVALIAALRKELAECQARIAVFEANGSVLSIAVCPNCASGNAPCSSATPGSAGPSGAAAGHMDLAVSAQNMRRTFLVQPNQDEENFDDSNQAADDDDVHVNDPRLLELEESIARRNEALENQTYISPEELTKISSVVHSLESQLRDVQAEKERLEAELASKTNKDKVCEDRRKRLKDLEDKLAKLSAELEKATKERETIRRKKEESEKKAEEAQREITRMKASRVELMKKMKEEAAAKRREHLAMERKMQGMKQENLKTILSQKRAISQSEKEKAVLAKRLADCSAALARMKDVQKKQQDANAYKARMQEVLNNPNKNKKLQAMKDWMSQEMELNIIRLKTKSKLDELIAERKCLAKQKLDLEETLSTTKENVTQEEREKFEEKIKTFQDNIKLQSSMITAMNTECQNMDMNAPVAMSGKKLDDMVRTLPDAKKLLNFLFQAVVTAKFEASKAIDERDSYKVKAEDARAEAQEITDAANKMKRDVANEVARLARGHGAQHVDLNTTMPNFSAISDLLDEANDKNAKLMADNTGLNKKVRELEAQLAEKADELKKVQRYNRRSVMFSQQRQPCQVESPLGPIRSPAMAAVAAAGATAYTPVTGERKLRTSKTINKTFLMEQNEDPQVFRKDEECSTAEENNDEDDFETEEDSDVSDEEGEDGGEEQEAEAAEADAEEPEDGPSRPAKASRLSEDDDDYGAPRSPPEHVRVNTRSRSKTNSSLRKANPSRSSGDADRSDDFVPPTPQMVPMKKTRKHGLGSNLDFLSPVLSPQDDPTRDPDWVKTPMQRRISNVQTKRTTLLKQRSIMPKHTITKCNCKNKSCSSNICGCRKAGKSCNFECGCNNCQNDKKASNEYVVEEESEEDAEET